MATRAVKVTSLDQRAGVVSKTWAGLLNTDDGQGVEAASLASISVQVVGTFGVGGEVTWEGSNDGGTTWVALRFQDAQSLAAKATDSTIIAVAERPLLIRPRVTAGDGTTSLTAILAGLER